MSKAQERPWEADEEPYVKSKVIMALYSISYSFISIYTKADPEHPDRPVMPHLRVGRDMRFRRSEVRQFMMELAAWQELQRAKRKK